MHSVFCCDHVNSELWFSHSIMYKVPRMKVNDSESDRKFITLLRQSHTLPFAPLKTALADGKESLEHPGAMFAVLQPIDDINTRVLDDLEQSHRDRTQWHARQCRTFGHASGQSDRGLDSASLKRPHPDSTGKNGSEHGSQPSKPCHDTMAQLPEAQV